MEKSFSSPYPGANTGSNVPACSISFREINMQNPTAVGINTLPAEILAARSMLTGPSSGNTDNKDAWFEIGQTIPALGFVFIECWRCSSQPGWTRVSLFNKTRSR
jgi:hypothetical protein